SQTSLCPRGRNECSNFVPGTAQGHPHDLRRNGVWVANCYSANSRSPSTASSPVSSMCWDTAVTLLIVQRLEGRKWPNLHAALSLIGAQRSWASRRITH